MSVADNAETLAVRTLDKQIQWTPDRLIHAAIAMHPDLDVARANLDAARAALLTASQRPNPTANVSVEHPWVTTLSLDIPIETNGKRGVRVAQAQALSIAAAADVDQAIWNVRTRVATAIADLGEARQLMELRREELRLREEIVAMLERRLAAGEAAQPDVTRVRADERSSRLALRDDEGRAAEREAALAAAIGIPRDALPPIDFTFADRVAAENARVHALTARPDVLAALARYDAAEQALRLEVRKQFPDITIGPGIGWDQGHFKWVVSASAELPIFNRHEGPIAEADARRSIAAAELLALQARILGDLERAMAAEASARTRVAEADRLVHEKESLVTTSRKQFAAGEIDRLALRSQEVEETLAKIDRWIAWFDLQRAIASRESAVEQD
jgi:outer membrane protein TolC